MKKHIKALALITALLLCLSLAACGSDNGGGNDDDGDISGGTPDSFEGMVKDSAYMAARGMYLGDWEDAARHELEIELSDDGQELRFTLYEGDDIITASGFIQTSPEYSADYFYNEYDGIAYHCWFADDGTLNVYELGEFTKEADDGDDIDDDIKELAGMWYLDGDENAASCLQIGMDGKWVLYEDNNGSTSLIDSGSIQFVGDDAYSAVSEQFDDVAYDIAVADDNTLYWGGEYDCYMRLG